MITERMLDDENDACSRINCMSEWVSVTRRIPAAGSSWRLHRVPGRWRTTGYWVSCGSAGTRLPLLQDEIGGFSTSGPLLQRYRGVQQVWATDVSLTNKPRTQSQEKHVHRRVSKQLNSRRLCVLWRTKREMIKWNKEPWIIRQHTDS